MKLFSSATLLVGTNAILPNIFNAQELKNSLGGMDMNKLLLMQMQQQQYKADKVNQVNDPTNAGMSNFLTGLNFLNTGNVGYQNNLANLLLGGESMTGMNKQDYMAQFKEQYMNQIYANMNNGFGGSSMMSPLLLQVAKEGTSNIDKDQFIYSQMPEPLGTIMRLKKNNEPKGTELLKRYFARTSNMFGDDEVPADLFIQGDTAGLKKYMIAKQIEQMKSAPGGDFTTALMYRKLTGQTADDSVTNKELMAAGMFAGQLDQNGAAVKPNDAYLMFKFLKLSSGKEGGKVPAKTILEIALGEDVASIKSQDFEQLFGVDQSEFICLAHENSVRVPCLVNQATVVAETCPKHCCFNPLSSAGDMQTDANVPICYHNLLGKIGAGIAKHMINDANIKSLFGGELPTLTDLTDATTWAESQMPEVLRRLNKDEGDFFGNPKGTKSWWEQTYDDKQFNIHVTPAPSTSNSRSSNWVPHGTDMPPGWIPQTGKYGVGSEIDNEELITLDQIISSELSKVRATLNQDSYTCKLVAKKDMVNCFINNYEALRGADPAQSCAAKGCCYREGNLFEEAPVCYRSLRNGYCDPYNPDESIDKTTKAYKWWDAHPQRKACGSQENVTKHQCELNPSCCFNDNPRLAGDPWCYYRGGVETLVAEGDASSDAQCNAVNILKRQHCFDNTNKFGKVLNKMATDEQCKTAGCCFDPEALKQNQELGGLLGGSLDLTGPHCFKKENDMLDNTDAHAATNWSGTGTGHKVPLYKPSELTKTCDDTKRSVNPLWPQLTQNKWVKNASGKWEFSHSSDERPAIREKCDATTDSHKCEYTLGCCFEKSSDPRHPWCYKPRYVKKASASVAAIPGSG
jgi:hypothetical protein